MFWWLKIKEEPKMHLRLSIIARGRVVLDTDIPVEKEPGLEDAPMRPAWERVSAVDTLITGAFHDLCRAMIDSTENVGREETVQVRISRWP